MGPWVDIHLLNLLDLAITSSRVMAYVCCWEPQDQRWEILVWDWKNGHLVLEISSAEGDRLVGYNTRALFLDEFRMMVFSVGHTGDSPEFTLFNTLTPQRHSRNLRRFRVPPRYRDWFVSVKTDREMPLGTLNRDGPLITDPAQAFLLVDLCNNDMSSHVFIVFRTQTLIAHACLISADTYIHWDELERDAMISYGDPDARFTYLCSGSSYGCAKDASWPWWYNPPVSPHLRL
ncbi:hypothetical protein BDM02DRAFT_3114447 [Thelephora ganbajun]|uniref:Uncharacterized protein n=1 Tax=Thelephora ganbajun TaxID=370292 RepID=A0ACB6ZH41_THEGA|nr:hypothetical protein BDM02DRAFT_3114447 [Thelephora ganbajun]